MGLLVVVLLIIAFPGLLLIAFVGLVYAAILLGWLLLIACTAIAVVCLNAGIWWPAVCVAIVWLSIINRD